MKNDSSRPRLVKPAGWRPSPRTAPSTQPATTAFSVGRVVYLAGRGEGRITALLGGGSAEVRFGPTSWIVPIDRLSPLTGARRGQRSSVERRLTPDEVKKLCRKIDRKATAAARGDVQRQVTRRNDRGGGGVRAEPWPTLRLRALVRAGVTSAPNTVCNTDWGGPVSASCERCRPRCMSPSLGARHASCRIRSPLRACGRGIAASPRAAGRLNACGYVQPSAAAAAHRRDNGGEP